MSGKKDFSTGLSKTRKSLSGFFSRWLKKSAVFDEEFWEGWEEALIGVDLGVTPAADLVESVREIAREKKITDPAVLKKEFEKKLLDLFADEPLPLFPPDDQPEPAVIMVVGVNGTGKTTTIAKLARKLQARGKKVLLAAGDTFRAAAVDQLGIWARRLDTELISQGEGTDPAAVAFDALNAASARGYDYLILDTAGRLHTRAGLMDELSKIVRVLRKISPSQPRRIFLCLDATFGQNGLIQAEKFSQSLPIDGVVLTKLDGTARGGIVISIRKELDVPVLAVGIGEGLDDLLEFNPEEFVTALLEE